MGRLIQWFVENPVAANVLMAIIAIGGLSNLAALNKEVFPGIGTGTVQVQVAYPGAGPREVEEQLVKRIEEAIADLDGIDEINSVARQSLAVVTIVSINDYDIQVLLNNVKSRVDTVDTFPANAERPQITEFLWESEIMSLGLYGDVDEALLKRTGERVRDEIALLPGISIVELEGTRSDEMSIEVSEQALRRYNLSFEQVVNAVRQSSLNLPAGTIRSDAGDIQLQTRGQAYYAEDFEDIVVDSRADGAQLLLGDVATITDGFTEQNVVSRLNGKPAVFLEVKSTDTPNVLTSAATIQQYIENSHHLLPNGVELTVWRDWSHLFKDRMELLLKNSISGLILVFLVLMLFLRPALAMWVSIGIAVAFMGTLWFMPYFGVSINMVSLFAFLLVLGIVVDDAIIVGESIYTTQQHGMKGNASAASGAKQVAKPVLFAVISTMMFFMPILSTPGAMGDMAYAIPIVVILSLFFSLVESLLILPSHLSHLKPEKPPREGSLLAGLSRARQRLAHGLDTFADKIYAPWLEKMLHEKAATLSGFIVAFALSVAVFNGGWLTTSFTPVVPSDFIRAKLTMPEGSSSQTTLNALQQMEKGVEALRQETTEEGHPDLILEVQSLASDNIIQLAMSLQEGEKRDLSATEIGERWRQHIGTVEDAEELTINSSINELSEDISLRLSISSDDEAELQRAVNAVESALARYPGIYSQRNSLTAARTEIELDMKPHGETLGLGLQDIARQVRQGFYGEEAQRIPRGSEDVKVMVRYSEAERAEIDQLEVMRIRTPDDREIPLETVADIEFVPGYTKIDRLDRKRSITITAEVEDGVADPQAIVLDLFARNTPQWQQEFPGFTLNIYGEMKDKAEFMSNAIRNFILVMLAIYGLMAIAFSSYWQPILILTAVPFGFMGAVIGHVIMGHGISMMSILGFFACAGVVVNDNLVLLDRINQLRKQGKETFDAVLQAGRDRFRPIILTSITTFIGLMPIMAETSFQAQFLIPMVVSLSFGVLFATSVTLILVPAMYLSAERIEQRLGNWRKQHTTETSARETTNT